MTAPRPPAASAKPKTATRRPSATELRTEPATTSQAPETRHDTAPPASGDRVAAAADAKPPTRGREFPPAKYPLSQKVNDLAAGDADALAYTLMALASEIHRGTASQRAQAHELSLACAYVHRIKQALWEIHDEAESIEWAAKGKPLPGTSSPAPVRHNAEVTQEHEAALVSLRALASAVRDDTGGIDAVQVDCLITDVMRAIHRADVANRGESRAAA